VASIRFHCLGKKKAREEARARSRREKKMKKHQPAIFKNKEKAPQYEYSNVNEAYCT
jgi:hypothetical protein